MFYYRVHDDTLKELSFQNEEDIKILKERRLIWVIKLCLCVFVNWKVRITEENLRKSDSRKR